MEKILRVNSQTSGNALSINTCNDFRNMDCPTIQAITVDEDGKLKYRSQGGLIGIYTEKTLDEIIAGLEALRPHVKEYEAKKQEQKQVSEVSKKKQAKKQAKKQEASEETDEKTMEKALKTLMSVGHSEAEARRILKLDQQDKEDKGDDLPEDIRITLQILLDKGMDKSKAYRTLGLTKNGKIDRRKKR